MGNGGYWIATRVLEDLQQAGKMDSFVKCLSGLKEAGEGQTKLAEGDFSSALAHSKKAAELFEQVPEARPLLGICKVDISAAYGGLLEYRRCVEYAREGLVLVSGSAELSYTQGTAHMNLGTALYALGDVAGALEHFTEATHILEKTPGGTQLAQITEERLKTIREEMSHDRPTTPSPSPQKLELRLGFMKPPIFAFVLDISHRRHKGIPLTDLQQDYITRINRLHDVTADCLEHMCEEHDWYFVFQLIQRFTDNLERNTRGFNVSEHAQNVRFLIDIYNACVGVNPWQPKKTRWGAWLSETGGWEERIRKLVYEKPLVQEDLRRSLDEALMEIRNLADFINRLELKWA
jgi:tetratricopeptide (TPR) repeat protein